MIYKPCQFSTREDGVCVCIHCDRTWKPRGAPTCDKVARPCPNRPKVRGLGDVVFLVLNRIGITRKRYLLTKCHVAKYLHYFYLLTTPTAESWCKKCGCKARQEALNRWVPFK